MRRRDFLAGCGAAGLAAILPGCTSALPPLPPGELSGTGFGLGHRLREKNFPPPAETVDIPVLIVGAGVAGLSAAWRLCREPIPGSPRFIVLELESQAGGNARYGENAISRYPLGAHYLPLPNDEARAVRALLSDLGVLRNDPTTRTLEYDEAYLCHAPQERLYRQGTWQEGLLPRLGVPEAELAQQERFFARMTQFRDARDKQGKRAFALPVAYSSESPEWAALDRLNMRDWMLREGFDAPSLHWYVDYACRDDYGTGHHQVSAWAGIHYFACRTGWGALRGGQDNEAVLTAPEGNGWLVDGLRACVDRSRSAGSDWLRTGQVVHTLRQTPEGCEADVWVEARQTCVRYRAEHLIWAAPLFLLPHLAVDLPADLSASIGTISHASWLVANLSLNAPPDPGTGAALAWDNVLQDSPSLGYVVSTHQQIRVSRGPAVLTWYHAFSEHTPSVARQMLLDTTWETWAEMILADLSRAHGKLREQVSRLDIFRHGHAMARPLPGFRDWARRERLMAGWGRVRLAHADVTGFSLFEESNYHGVRAAEAILSAHGLLRTSLLFSTD